MDLRLDGLAIQRGVADCGYRRGHLDEVSITGVQVCAGGRLSPHAAEPGGQKSAQGIPALGRRRLGQLCGDPARVPGGDDEDGQARGWQAGPRRGGGERVCRDYVWEGSRVGEDGGDEGGVASLVG